MNKNGEAIYNTRITKNYKDGNTWFTQNPKTGVHYALVCLAENETMPATVSWHYNLPVKGSRIKLLQTGESLRWKIEGDAVSVSLPASMAKAKQAALAFAFVAQ